MSKPETVDLHKETKELWLKYFEKVDSLNDKERELFCKYMEELTTPFIFMDSDHHDN